MPTKLQQLNWERAATMRSLGGAKGLLSHISQSSRNSFDLDKTHIENIIRSIGQLENTVKYRYETRKKSI